MKNFRYILFAGIWLLLLVGCGMTGDKDVAGLYNQGEKDEFYIISLPENHSVDYYFKRKGKENERYLNVTEVKGDFSQVLDTYRVKLKSYSVVEGGYVVYRGSIVGYVPPGVTVEIDGLIARSEREDCMSIETAKKYISFLKE